MRDLQGNETVVDRHFTIVAAGPAVSASDTTPLAGSDVVANVTGGPGNRADWIGLYRAGAAPAAMLDWRYLDGTRTLPAAGRTTANVTFRMPMVAGAHEFRLYADNGYGLLATSAAMIVANPAQPTLAATPSSVSAGGTVTVGVNGGPGNARDWVGLYAASGNDFQIIDWRYLGGSHTPPASGLTSASLTFRMPQAPGSYNFRFFADDGYARLAISSPVNVAGSNASASVLGPTTVAPGMTVQMQVSGPGNPRDWVGLFCEHGQRPPDHRLEVPRRCTHAADAGTHERDAELSHARRRRHVQARASRLPWSRGRSAGAEWHAQPGGCV